MTLKVQILYFKLIVTLIFISLTQYISAMETNSAILSEQSLNDAKIIVNIHDQKLYLLTKNDEILKKYTISTSKFGIGSKANTGKTPLGWHRIENKIGTNAPIGTIFKGRQNTGRIAKINAENGDLVTTRIMWLKGLEVGKNSGAGIDSYKRYIYIHGTAEENKLGQPASHGCIRMFNHDVIELFGLVKEHTEVNIINQETIPNLEELLDKSN